MNNEEKEKPDKKSITFQPDDDVREMLADVLTAYGNPYGLQSRLINDALREDLPRIVERWLARQREAQEKIAARFAKHKKGQKGQ